MEFYRAEPTAVTSWRVAVLMGANSRTYKFALGAALLDLAAEGQQDVGLDELARRYAMGLVERARHYPQGPVAATAGESDFLTVLAQESEQTRQAGAPTERLLAAAAQSIPQMVMQKFHNLRGTGPVPHRFYELVGTGRGRSVRLTADLHAVAVHRDLLVGELGARWSIVEVCFDAGIGRTLVDRGVVLGADRATLLSANRRVPVTGARHALSGFQHGRCFYCTEPLRTQSGAVHVDHLYPVSLMLTGAWTGPDMNGVWNLVVACAACNLAKTNRLPAAIEVARLLARNEAIMASPHPLRRTIELSMGGSPNRPAMTARARAEFVQAVDILATDRGLT